MTNSSRTQEQLKPLFEVITQYQEGLVAITSAEGKVGGYLGSGKGKVYGQQMQGEMRWDLYEDIADDVCQTNFVGEIYTVDGATIAYAVGINAQRDIATIRRLIERRIPVDAAELADPTKQLNAMLKR